MVYFYLVLSILALFFIGYVPVYFLLPGKGGFRLGSKTISGSFFVFFLSFYTGSLVVSWIMMVLSLLDLKYDMQLIYGISAAFFILYIYILLSLRFRNRERKRTIRLEQDILAARKSERLSRIKKNQKNRNGYKELQEKGSRGSNADGYPGGGGPGGDEDRFVAGDGILDTGNSIVNAGSIRKERAQKALFIILVILIVLNFFVVVFFTVIFPIKFWDAISCWSLKGRAFFIDGIINNFYLEHDYTFSHPSYPLYLPIMQTWVLSWIGEMNENLLKLIFPVIYSSLLFTLYYLFRQRLGRLLSVSLVFIVSVLPIIVDHGYIEYANLLFSVIMLLAVYFLYMSGIMNGKTSYLILSAIFFSIMALTRSEGIFYILLFLVINLFFYLYGTAKKISPGKNLLNLLAPITVFVLFLGPWFLLKVKLRLPFLSSEWVDAARAGGIFSGISGIREAAAVMGSQLWLSIYDSTRAIFGSFYGPVWIFLVVLLLLNIKKHFRNYSWIFFVFICFGLAGVFLSLACIEDFRNSTERYMLHLFPVFYYWVMSAPPDLIHEK
ncbi:MAG: glycosyltransferase family 39 protein [Actinobacteria bacterium]|nr:glycosyltransferase family 39 protein [Actinomycetota bacterium]